ncbi:MAG: RNA-directed DNA polymerase [Desulfuromonadales bacterium]
MRRTGNLYHKIAEPDNLRQAFFKAVRSKQDRLEVQDYREHLDENLASLHQQLINKSVDVGNYRFFTIHDPKERRICAAAFRERVLHHAIMNVCEPVLDRYSIFDSYACRSGKGQRAAVARAREFAGKYAWYLKLDIRKYFDSINHEALLKLLTRRFKDEHLLAMFRKIIETYHTLPGQGLPIGNLVSQHFANFYLGLFDHWIKEMRRVSGYLRYMDDYVLFNDSREALKDDLAQIKSYLGDNLHLELKDNIQLNRTACGVPFLGMRVYPNMVKLSARSRMRFVRKLRDYEMRTIRGEMEQRELAGRVSSLIEFTRIAESKGFRRSVIRRKGVFS